MNDLLKALDEEFFEWEIESKRSGFEVHIWPVYNAPSVWEYGIVHDCCLEDTIEATLVRCREERDKLLRRQQDEHKVENESRKAQ